MRRLFGRAVAAVALAAFASGAAQAGPRMGDRSADPAADALAELGRECGGATLAAENVSYGDFNGDGLEDVVILMEAECGAAGPQYCLGPRGCAHRVWVGEAADRFRLAADVLANEATTATWRGRPAIQFDGGPVYVWDGRDFVLASDSATYARGAGAAGAPEDGVTAPARAAEPPDAEADGEADRAAVEGRGRIAPPKLLSPRLDDDAADLGEAEPLRRGSVAPPRDVWRLGGRGARVGGGVENRFGGRLTLVCRPGDEAFRLLLAPDVDRLALLPESRGAEVLFEFVVDGRVVDARLMRRRVGGVWTDRGALVDGWLVDALRRGGGVVVREAGGGPDFATFALAGSRSVIDAAADACGM